MYIACCENCRYLDLLQNEAAKCPRCKGKMVSLDVDSAVWNAMSKEDKEAVLDEKVPRPQDVRELFREWLALKTGLEEAAPEEEAAFEEGEVSEEITPEEDTSEESDSVSYETEFEEVVAEEPAPEEAANVETEQEEPASEQKGPEEKDVEPAVEYPRIIEYVYVCYKCNSIAGHDGENEGYYCPECGSAMVETGFDTIEWANLSKEEKRNVMEGAKIRHMLTAIKEASYEDGESEKTQSIINVVGNNPYLNPERK